MTIVDERATSLDPVRPDPFGDGARANPGARLVALPAFRRLLALKRRAVGPMIAFYVVAYFGVMLLMGFARPAMGAKLVGPLTVGYALVLGLYAMCWLIAGLYTFAATRWFDPAAVAAREAAPGVEATTVATP